MPERETAEILAEVSRGLDDIDDGLAELRADTDRLIARVTELGRRPQLVALLAREVAAPALAEAAAGKGAS